MSNERFDVNIDQQSAALPAGLQGVLSTGLTDNSPAYVWFDCEMEL
jgi:hypothetical protein